MPGHGIFVTGATGYLERRVVPEILTRGHSVGTLAHPGSEGKLPHGVAVGMKIVEVPEIRRAGV